MSSSRSSRWFLPLLFAARLAVGLTYSLITPIWEAYDEDGHFAYAYYVARHGTLLQPGDPEAEQVWEKFQPPLYYILAALPLTAFDFDQPLPARAQNPFLRDGTTYNYALHPDRLQGRDYQIALAVLTVRVVGVLLSTLSVFFVYRAACLIWPMEATTAWTAALVYAFWPQFLFVGSMVTNDALVTVLSAIAFYFALQLIYTGFRLRYALPLGGLLGCALLTKLNAFALVPMAGSALVVSLTVHTIRRAGWKSPRLWLAVTIVGLILLAAVWLLTSQRFVVSHIFQVQTVYDFLGATGEVAGPSGAKFVWAFLQYGFRTYLASFGWGNLETYAWLYWLWGPGAGLAVVGLLVRVVRRTPNVRWSVLGLLTLHVLSVITLDLALALALDNIFIGAGRYLLLSLPAVAVLLVSGWSALLPRAWRVPTWKIVGAGIVLVSWSIPLWTLAPAYAKPRPQTVPADVPMSFRFGEAIELLGYDRPEPVRPGDEAKVTLCWQATAPISQNYTVFLEIVGPDSQGYGRLVTYPGRGNYATSLWAVRTPFCDRYAVPLGETIPAPAAAEMRVSLLVTTDVNGERLPVTDAAGGPIQSNAVSIPLKIRAVSPAPVLAQRVEYRFGDELVLRGYELKPASEGHTVRVVLRWEALKDLLTNYTIFVHLRDTPDHAYTLGDSPPRNGWYPTSLWQKGEVVLDEHTLTLPSGNLPPLALYIGAYATDTGVRLPAFDAEGKPIPNGEVMLEQDLTFPAR